MPMYEAPSPDPTQAVLIADAATWEAVIARIGTHSRDALALRAAVEQAPNPKAIRVMVSRELAATLWARSQQAG